MGTFNKYFIEGGKEEREGTRTGGRKKSRKGRRKEGNKKEGNKVRQRVEAEGFSLRLGFPVR